MSARDGGLIAGHARILAARQLGIAEIRQPAGDYRIGLGPGAAAARTRRVEALEMGLIRQSEYLFRLKEAADRVESERD